MFFFVFFLPTLRNSSLCTQEHPERGDDSLVWLISVFQVSVCDFFLLCDILSATKKRDSQRLKIQEINLFFFKLCQVPLLFLEPFSQTDSRRL